MRIVRIVRIVRNISTLRVTRVGAIFHASGDKKKKDCGDFLPELSE